MAHTDQAVPHTNPPIDPAKERVFHMLVRDGDVYSPSNYVAIPAVLRGWDGAFRFTPGGRISTRLRMRRFLTS